MDESDFCDTCSCCLPPGIKCYFEAETDEEASTSCTKDFNQALFYYKQRFAEPYYVEVIL